MAATLLETLVEYFNEKPLRITLASRVQCGPSQPPPTFELWTTQDSANLHEIDRSATLCIGTLSLDVTFGQLFATVG